MPSQHPYWQELGNDKQQCTPSPLEAAGQFGTLAYGGQGCWGLSLLFWSEALVHPEQWEQNQTTTKTPCRSLAVLQRQESEELFQASSVQQALT